MIPRRHGLNTRHEDQHPNSSRLRVFAALVGTDSAKIRNPVVSPSNMQQPQTTDSAGAYDLECNLHKPPHYAHDCLLQFAAMLVRRRCG